MVCFLWFIFLSLFLKLPRVNSLYRNESREPRERGGFRVLNRLLILGVIAGVGVLGKLLFYPLLEESREQDKQIARLERELSDARATHAWRTREEGLLKNDREYIELIARDRLDMMKPGETIIRLEAKEVKSGK